MRRRSATLTEQEFEIMKVVWERRQSSPCATFLRALLERRKVAYTTVMTMMKILEQKQYLGKADRPRLRLPPRQPKGQVIRRHGARVRQPRVSIGAPSRCCTPGGRARPLTRRARGDPRV